jgi:SAM-dependent methyltransferase
MNNYDFCAAWGARRVAEGRGQVLDYGCGAGQIVSALLARGVDAYGCDVFYGGGDYSSQVEATLFAAQRVRRIEDGRIPFPDATFDLVVNNQVMEHVEDLDQVLAEIHRVLRPGGRGAEPVSRQGVWREGHCGIPFLHWFPKGSRPRVYYAAALRAVGLGYYKQDKSILRWSRDFCDWLDRWTHYRSRREVHEAYRRRFQRIEHVEPEWLRARLGSACWLAAMAPRAVQAQVVNRLSQMVFVATKV